MKFANAKILFLICLTSTFSMVTSHDDEQAHIRTCKFSHKKQDMPPIFNWNGTDLPSNRRHFTISTWNISECQLNLTQVVNTYNFTSTTQPLVGYFQIQCDAPIRVYIESYHGTRFPQIVQYIKIVKCVTSLSDLNEIASVGTLRVIFMLESVLVTDELHGNHTQCDNLKSVSSFAYSYPKDGSRYNASFEDVLSCTPVFEHLAEVIFSGMAWSALPETLEQKCPNLQSLDVPENKFTKPPTSFPWTRQVFNLPGGLSRSKFLQSHYVNTEYLSLQEDIFRRTYRLDDNLIQNLSDFSFHGFLHYLSLERNTMVNIDENAFNNVTGLQYLSLKENLLTSLPCNVFKSLNGLANLDLSKNKLVSLCADTFQNLVNLKHLNLANNSLSVFEDGLFQPLENLQLLHLEFNKIKILNAMTFPLRSLQLKEIHLFNNPLALLPEFLFWIRPLLKADLHNTKISFDNLTTFIEMMDDRRVEESVGHSLSYINFKKSAETLKENPRIIDLSDSQITGFNLKPNMSSLMEYRLRLIFLNYKFILKNNPIFCDCNILQMSRFVNELVSNDSVAASLFMDWTCTSPFELQGKQFISVRPEETYCRVEIDTCPTECGCFQREINDHIIVDCRGRNLTHIHDKLPDGKLELWYSNNSITTVSINSNYIRVVSFDVSANKIDFIDDKVPSQLVNMKYLQLNDNILSYLPQGFAKLTLDKLTLSPNPWSCDCNTLWMKNWLISQVNAVDGLGEITCYVNNEDGNVVIKVPDEQFVCDKASEVDSLTHVVLPSVTSTAFVILVMAILIVTYAYRQECKVLMFVYFGVHPFDKDCSEGREFIDCIVVHSGEQTDWVMENIVKLLESEQLAYTVCDMARDFMVGFSFQENLTRMVKHSKRIVFCLTKDWDCSSESFIMSWNIAQEKIKETRSNFGIVVTHEVSRDQIKDKDLLRFLKRKRNVDTKERLFTKKLLYYMPTAADTNTTPEKFAKLVYENQTSVIEINESADTIISSKKDNVNGSEMCHAFISYCDDDIDFVTKELQPLLEEQGFQLCIPDRDFIPGESKETNILNSIESSMRTIIVISSAHLHDEWSLFTFRHAYEKTLRQKNNHLIVIVLEDLTDHVLDNEVRHYLKHYIYLRVDDQWYQQKLFNGLPLLKDKEHLHTTPLYPVYSYKRTSDVDNIVLHF